MTRSESQQAMLDELGAVTVVADARDPDQVAEAVGRARPDVIVHQLTAIGAIDPRHFDRDFAPVASPGAWSGACRRARHVAYPFPSMHAEDPDLVPGWALDAVKRRPCAKGLMLDAISDWMSDMGG
jgi:hypothetical protein